MSIQDYYDNPVSLPVFAPDELIGMTILKKVDNDIIEVQTKVSWQIIDHEAENPQKIKFLLLLYNRALEEIIYYSKLSDLVSESIEAGESGQNDFLTYSGF